MKKIIAVVSLMLCFCILFSGCGDETVTPIDIKQTEICILLGKTANVKELDTKNFEEIFLDAAYSQSTCSIIVLDGTPEEISLKYEFPEIKSKLEDNRREHAKSNVDELNDKISSLKPDSEEIDIIKGLKTAEKALASKESKRELIIYSSGLSTSGILNFAERPDLLYKNPTEIVETLEEEDAIPDLSGINVIWYGLGNVAEPQKELSYTEEENLKNVWNEILEACNVNVTEETFVDVVSLSNEEENLNINYPRVSVVELLDSDDCIWSLDEETIGFVANSAEFLDREATTKKLVPYANLMISSNKNFYIIGSTATYGNYNNCIALSQERAQAIKDVLIELNVPEDSIEIFGVGQENLGGEYNWRVNDLDNNQNLIESEAKKNRKVMIIDATSNAGKDFINDWNESDLSK